MADCGPLLDVLGGSLDAFSGPASAQLRRKREAVWQEWACSRWRKSVRFGMRRRSHFASKLAPAASSSPVLVMAPARGDANAKQYCRSELALDYSTARDADSSFAGVPVFTSACRELVAVRGRITSGGDSTYSCSQPPTACRGRGLSWRLTQAASARFGEAMRCLGKVPVAVKREALPCMASA